MIAAAHEEMVRSGLVEPVEVGGGDERAWLDCDLASLAEHRLGDRTDPRAIDKERRAHWKARATTERPYPLRVRNEYELCYWLMEGGERRGTVALTSPDSFTGGLTRLSSFYVYPDLRGRGVGRRALDRIEGILGGHGIGLRLETSWTWPRTVRFYVRAGMWVYMWKRELTFCWSQDTPPPHIEVGEHEARLSVRVDGEDVVLQRARRRGDRLELDEMPGHLERDRRLGKAPWNAMSTLSLALAMAGWPLVRSDEEQRASSFADAGPPEALASRIVTWEARDRHRGWVVETPRIPGLVYSTWEELQARWDAANRAFQEKVKRGEPL